MADKRLAELVSLFGPALRVNWREAKNPMHSDTTSPIDAIDETAVFLGPSLALSEASTYLTARFLPPARKGDIYRLIPSGVKRIVLLDGVFHNTPSVWQRELLAAIDEGITVIGATSMGALRAAELHPYGMIGYGIIFGWYRDGLIDGDDEVALRHATQENNFRALSEPLVNIRYTLQQAVLAGCLTEEQREALVTEAKSLYYADRSFSRLLESACFERWGDALRDRFRAYLSQNRVNLKRQDAIGALRYCASLNVPSDMPAQKGTDRQSLWHAMQSHSAGFYGEWGRGEGSQVLRLAETKGREFDGLRRENAVRQFVAEWARQNGVRCPDLALKEFLEQWRREKNLPENSPAEASWLAANGLTRTQCRRLLEERCLVEWILRQGPRYFGLYGTEQTALLNELQITGLAAQLLGEKVTE